jgi:hypothetical protein
VVRRATALMACALVVAAAAGCARPRPQVEPEVQALALPAPPPRTLPPLEGGPIEAAGAAAPEPPRQQRPLRPRADATRGNDNGRTEARAEVPKVEPQPGEPLDEPSAPAPALQLAPTADTARIEQNIRVQLQRANSDLGRIDTRVLGADARIQYDTAKRFIILADQAIRDRNLVYAQTLADKARVIASVLLGR